MYKGFFSHGKVTRKREREKKSDLHFEVFQTLMDFVHNLLIHSENVWLVVRSVTRSIEYMSLFLGSVHSMVSSRRRVFSVSLKKGFETRPPPQQLKNLVV